MSAIVPAQPGALSEYEKQRLSAVAGRVSTACGISFGALFTVLGIAALGEFFRRFFVADPCDLWHGLMLFASVVCFCCGIPVLKATVKPRKLDNAYFMPLFVFCAAAQTKATHNPQKNTPPLLGRSRTNRMEVAGLLQS